MTSKDAAILLVEDNADDVLLIQRAFRKIGVAQPLHVVGDGDAAVAWLNGTPPYADRGAYPLPVLVLLDLKLPRRDGFDVLAWTRQQPGLRRLPIVVLTSSTQKQDLNRAYDAGANSYLAKPVEFDDLLELIRGLNLYWLVQNEHPDLN